MEFLYLGARSAHAWNARITGCPKEHAYMPGVHSYPGLGPEMRKEKKCSTKRQHKGLKKR